MLAAVGGIATLVNKDVVVALHGDVVVADGHADGELAFCIGHDGHAFHDAGRAVHLEGATVHGNGGAGIAHSAMHGEVADVGEVHAAVHQ